MSGSKKTFLNLLAEISVVLGFIAALVAFINLFIDLFQDTRALRVTSLVGYIIFLMAIIWLAFRATDVSSRWRWLGFVVLYLVTIFYFIWVGTWLGNSWQNSVDLIINPINLYSYNFENIQKVPLGITATGNAENLEIANDIYLPNGKQSLAVELELPAWSSSSDNGGITVSLGTSRRVDAISAGIFIPEAANTRDGNFKLYFAAINAEEKTYFSGSQSVPVGRWSFQFWGTRYAHSDGNLCPDANLDNQCDQPANSYWYSWTDNSIEDFSILITRDGKPYDGIVYIDDIETYLVK